MLSKQFITLYQNNKFKKWKQKNINVWRWIKNKDSFWGERKMCGERRRNKTRQRGKTSWTIKRTENCYKSLHICYRVNASATWIYFRIVLILIFLNRNVLNCDPHIHHAFWCLEHVRRELIHIYKFIISELWYGGKSLKTKGINCDIYLFWNSSRCTLLSHSHAAECDNVNNTW